MAEKLKGFCIRVVKGADWRLAGKSFLLFILSVLSVNEVMGLGAERLKGERARETVCLLYDFGTPEQLGAQQVRLKKYVTGSVYDELTVDNEERRLNTYLKFYGCASTVHFSKVTDRYIIYWLECAAIDSSRRFLFCYDMDASGRICRVREAEIIDFMENEN